MFYQIISECGKENGRFMKKLTNFIQAGEDMFIYLFLFGIYYYMLANLFLWQVLGDKQFHHIIDKDRL